MKDGDGGSGEVGSSGEVQGSGGVGLIIKRAKASLFVL